MSFGAQVIAAMEARGMTARELQRRTGVSYDVIVKLKQRPGSSTSVENALKLSEALGIDLKSIENDDSASYSDSEINTISKAPGERLAHIVGLRSGDGGANMLDGKSSVDLALPERHIATIAPGGVSRLRGLTVRGDAMAPTLLDGDLVLLDLGDTDISHDGIFAISEAGGSAIIKRIGRASKSGCVTLISDNRAVYPAVERPCDDIAIVGRAVWKGGRL